MHGPSEPNEVAWELDPQFLQARREMFVVLGMFFASFVWTMTASYLLGYRTPSPEEAKELVLIWGMPLWVFWGVLAPWLAIDIAAVWFCFFYMQDEAPLGSEGMTPSGAAMPRATIETNDGSSIES